MGVKTRPSRQGVHGPARMQICSPSTLGSTRQGRRSGRVGEALKEREEGSQAPPEGGRVTKLPRRTGEPGRGGGGVLAAPNPQEELSRERPQAVWDGVAWWGAPPRPPGELSRKGQPARNHSPRANTEAKVSTSAQNGDHSTPGSALGGHRHNAGTHRLPSTFIPVPSM